jgi:hypothetical protein
MGYIHSPSQEKYVMNFKMLLFVGLLWSAAVCARAADLVIAENGKTDYQVVIPDSSASTNIHVWLNNTARLFQDVFRTNGFDAPVVTESARDQTRPGIYLGATEFALANGVTFKKHSGWSYAHKVVGKDVIVAGNDHPSSVRADPADKNRRTIVSQWPRVGTVKAAADFLRQYMGVSFLYPDIGPWSTFPTNEAVSILDSPAVEFLKTPAIRIPSDLDVFKTPSLEYNTGGPARAGFFDIANNMFPRVDIAFGCHTYERAIPPGTYSKTHPEYFALINQQRTSDGQYCISNPEVQELFYKDVARLLDMGFAIADLGQPDGFRACQCEKCKKLFDTDDWSEKLWILHRKIAERVLKSYPDRKIMLMAYMHTEKTPKTFKKFPENVMIMLCGTNEKDFNEWREIEVPGGFTSYIYNWCANQAGRYNPMRTPRYVEAQALRLYTNSVHGINRDGPGDLFGLEGPVYYTFARMFDDPENNTARMLVDEFCAAAFGKAAGAMQQFYATLYHGIELYSEFLGTRCPAWTYTSISGGRRKFLNDPFQIIAFLNTPEMLSSMENNLSQAEKAADSEKARQRLALVRLEFDYIKNLAAVVHLYHAFQIRQDRASRDRLLDAIDARNAQIKECYKPLPGWKFKPFPPGGHDANHLRLKYNLYQGPFQDTCLNWDTKVMRDAPLPGAGTIKVNFAKEAPGMESQEWRRSEAQGLGILPGTATSLVFKTAMRALYDRQKIYLRFEGELPAGMTNFAAVARDGDFAKEESLDIIIAPFGNRDRYYRFKVGPQGSSKYDAANGFITDPMDPRIREDDPAWNGEWAYDCRFEKKKRNTWMALLSIPFKTLGVDPPAAGAIWMGNFGRSHYEGTNLVERSIWTANPDTKWIDSREAFGTIAFEDKKP